MSPRRGLAGSAVLEASIDLDSITRGHINPFAAVLTVQKTTDSFAQLSMPTPSTPTCLANPQDPTCQQQATGLVVPRAAFANMIRIDLVFRPDHHMVLDYTVRVRDHRGILEDKGLSAPSCTAMIDPCAMLFMPTVYKP